MTAAATWSTVATDGEARRGTLSLTHGEVATPAFMAVGTRGAVRAVDVEDLVAAGAEIVLANTYHLMLRPGAEQVAALGGLHGFMSWDRPILTDSGGYQVYSLAPAIDEEGAVFRSTYDGSLVSLTPEEAVRVQELLGADVAMALDVCIGLPAEDSVARQAMELTLRWEERALAVHTRPDQALFGIVQGGADPDLRSESARRTAELGFVGFGIGGLSVGESAMERERALEATMPFLPFQAVRYVMGLGDAEGVLAAVERGADLFDCVWPTRLARHGKVLTARGDYNLKRSELMSDPRPLEEGCECLACTTHSRAYLRHLIRNGEQTGHRMVSIHNLTYTFGLLASARDAISQRSFLDFRSAVLEERSRAAVP